MRVTATAFMVLAVLAAASMAGFGTAGGAVGGRSALLHGVTTSARSRT
jgi:hypothetical protein